LSATTSPTIESFVEEVSVPIKVSCPSCKAAFKAPDNAAGKKAKCPQCNGPIEIPFPEPVGGLLDAEVAPDWGFDDEDFEVAAPFKSPEAEERKPCPMCGEMIAREAVKCRYCGEVFDPALKKKMKKKSKSYSDGDDDLSTGEWVVAILCSGIGCIMGLIFLIQGKPKAGKMIGVSVLAGILWSVLRAVIEAMAQGQP
jgi:predicted RNA-binding Zn-ribbon protein involved in translation (DUF1610 family)